MCIDAVMGKLESIGTAFHRLEEKNAAEFRRLKDENAALRKDNTALKAEKTGIKVRCPSEDGSELPPLGRIPNIVCTGGEKVQADRPSIGIIGLDLNEDHGTGLDLMPAREEEEDTSDVVLQSVMQTGHCAKVKEEDKGESSRKKSVQPATPATADSVILPSLSHDRLMTWPYLGDDGALSPELMDTRAAMEARAHFNVVAVHSITQHTAAIWGMVQLSNRMSENPMAQYAMSIETSIDSINRVLQTLLPNLMAGDPSSQECFGGPHQM
uniref:Uncharacterized protein n=1 Tax=Pseudictyota dubia TaxID=2749911 RepID=A0A7R9WEN3_9STRA|mmetsp:Transcript_47421/g.88053  ORF Transcript_47421/g.88053 Transcript_47421/m.88053 type:complete len:269 (+) Transcript_47421:764-1570(+)